MAYEFGKCRLRELLKKTGMSQMDLAIKLNVKKQQINKYVTNERVMSLLTAKKIASILHCRIEDLYEWIEVGDNE